MAKAGTHPALSLASHAYEGLQVAAHVGRGALNAAQQAGADALHAGLGLAQSHVFFDTPIIDGRAGTRFALSGRAGTAMHTKDGFFGVVQKFPGPLNALEARGSHRFGSLSGSDGMGGTLRLGKNNRLNQLGRSWQTSLNRLDYSLQSNHRQTQRPATATPFEPRMAGRPATASGLDVTLPAWPADAPLAWRAPVREPAQPGRLQTWTAVFVTHLLGLQPLYETQTKASNEFTEFVSPVGSAAPSGWRTPGGPLAVGERRRLDNTWRWGMTFDLSPLLSIRLPLLNIARLTWAVSHGAVLDFRDEKGVRRAKLEQRQQRDWRLAASMPLLSQFGLFRQIIARLFPRIWYNQRTQGKMSVSCAFDHNEAGAQDWSVLAKLWQDTGHAKKIFGPQLSCLEVASLEQKLAHIEANLAKSGAPHVETITAERAQDGEQFVGGSCDFFPFRRNNQLSYCDKLRRGAAERLTIVGPRHVGEKKPHPRQSEKNVTHEHRGKTQVVWHTKICANWNDLGKTDLDQISITHRAAFAAQTDALRAARCGEVSECIDGLGKLFGQHLEKPPLLHPKDERTIETNITFDKKQLDALLVNWVRAPFKAPSLCFSEAQLKVLHQKLQGVAHDPQQAFALLAEFIVSAKKDDCAPQAPKKDGGRASAHLPAQALAAQCLRDVAAFAAVRPEVSFSASAGIDRTRYYRAQEVIHNFRAKNALRLSEVQGGVPALAATTQTLTDQILSVNQAFNDLTEFRKELDNGFHDAKLKKNLNEEVNKMRGELAKLLPLKETKDSPLFGAFFRALQHCELSQEESGKLRSVIFARGANQDICEAFANLEQTYATVACPRAASVQKAQTLVP